MKELNVGTATELVRRWRRCVAGLDENIRYAKGASVKSADFDAGRRHAYEAVANELEALYLPKEDRQ